MIRRLETRRFTFYDGSGYPEKMLLKDNEKIIDSKIVECLAMDRCGSPKPFGDIRVDVVRVVAVFIVEVTEP